MIIQMLLNFGFYFRKSVKEIGEKNLTAMLKNNKKIALDFASSKYKWTFLWPLIKFKAIAPPFLEFLLNESAKSSLTIWMLEKPEEANWCS